MEKKIWNLWVEGHAPRHILPPIGSGTTTKNGPNKKEK